MKKSRFGFSLIEMSLILLIIGIGLVSAISASILVDKAKFETMRNLTRNSPIPSIKGAFIWVETISEESFSEDTEDSSKIALWKNIIPIQTSSLNFSQTNANYMPIYVKDGFRGFPIVRFDGVNDFLATENIDFSSFLAGVDNTTFLVFKIKNNVNPVAVFSLERNPSNKYGLEYSSSAKVLSFDFDNQTSGRLNSNVDVFDKFIILRLQRRLGVQSLAINGKIRASKTNNFIISSFSERLILGSRFTSGTYINPLKGDIAEIAIFERALDDEEINEVESYLSRKWRIKLDE